VKSIHSSLLMIVLGALLLAACAGQAAATPAISSTPSLAPTADPCGPEHLPINAARVHQLTRAFDDAYQLASSTPRSQLADQVSRLQDLRRAAQDQAVPVCLVQLKKLQLGYMELGVNTMLTFLQGGDTTAINQGVALVRQAHDVYTLEFARLLGVTLVPAASGTSGAQAPSAPQAATPLPELAVVNNGAGPVNLRMSASLTSQAVGTLDSGASAPALGRSANGEWILIQNPSLTGQTAWVYATLVQVSGDPSTLAVVTPTP
jgi:hypothetical protein